MSVRGTKWFRTRGGTRAVEVPISRAQFPTFPAILRDYRVYHRPHKSSHISKHVKIGCYSGILCLTLGTDPWQIPVLTCKLGFILEKWIRDTSTSLPWNRYQGGHAYLSFTGLATSKFSRGRQCSRTDRALRRRERSEHRETNGTRRSPEITAAHLFRLFWNVAT